MDPKSLPIRKYQKEIVDAVRDNVVTVVIGETGSGKTTQLSQMLLEDGLGGKGECHCELRSPVRWWRGS